MAWPGQSFGAITEVEQVFIRSDNHKPPCVQKGGLSNHGFRTDFIVENAQQLVLVWIKE